MCVLSISGDDHMMCSCCLVGVNLVLLLKSHRCLKFVIVLCIQTDMSCTMHVEFTHLHVCIHHNAYIHVMHERFLLLSAFGLAVQKNSHPTYMQFTIASLLIIVYQ